MRFARWTFVIAGLYGILVLLPGFFLEAQVAVMAPPAISHPEFYYGFDGSAVVWQFVFFVIARDPLRFRPLILVSVLEKLSFLGACIALYAAGRLALGGPLLGGLIDGIWAVLFVIAWRRTRPAAS